MRPLLPTEQRHEQAQRVSEFIELLESFLAGRAGASGHYTLGLQAVVPGEWSRGALHETSRVALHRHQPLQPLLRNRGCCPAIGPPT
jgi:hypothetical protein